MVTLITIIHIILAILLVLITFIQDSKSESLGGAFGGGSSQSLLGPIAATTVFQKLTWYLIVAFAITSIGLAYLSTRSNRSVLDSVPLVEESVSGSQDPSTSQSESQPSSDRPVE